MLISGLFAVGSVRAWIMRVQKL